ncbi:MAG: helix-turn-helix transcriptional regulator [Bacteroidota bacterium]
MLSSLSRGNSYKLIAAEFDISVDTVRTHLKKIYEKLQVHSQTRGRFEGHQREVNLRGSPLSVNMFVVGKRPTKS